ncbi:MAG: LuxR C-terminal-related transcriptional regulator [Acidimicrobiia bacterium]|nr:LuxR C-terminal-related transcriptional regulator [Acidimicrobiia bacterium]
MSETPTQAEIAALLAVAQDHAFGQPPGAQLRATVLAQELAAAVGLDESARETTWWTSTLRFLGCTGHAFETATLFGDEIEVRAWSLRADASNPVELLRKMVSLAGAGSTGIARVQAVVGLLATGRAAARSNFQAACEVADAFAARLGLDDDLRSALAANFERWNGKGLPRGLKATAIPVPMRIAQIAQEFEVLARSGSVAASLDVMASRRAKAYDPEITDVVLSRGRRWWDVVHDLDPWDAALEHAPVTPPLQGEALRNALVLLADFADLKSPSMAGHSRAVAALVVEACGPGAEAGALVHDIGRVAVPNSIWDKPGPLTRDERDRVEMHSLVTEQLLRRLPLPPDTLEAACGAHERLDRSGYHRRAGGPHLGEVARVIAAADVYQAMISDRPHRPASSSAEAAAELRAMADAGSLDGEAVERVLEAAGHPRRSRVALPAGLTAREVEVLRLLTLGLTTRQAAARLFISTKTADRHVQNTYRKLGVSTRGAAALFAIEHGLVVEAV